LVDPEDVMAKMVYALTNPAKDDLVDAAEDWPGINAFSSIVAGKEMTATRPGHFFREDGSMPKTLSLSFTRPPGFEAMSVSEFAAMVSREVRAVETEARNRRALTGKRVLGRRAILDQDWRARPHSSEPRRERNPRVAAKQKWSRIEALLRNKDFVQTYRSRFSAFKQGIKDLFFPAGTYWLKRFASVACVPVADAAPAASLSLAIKPSAP
jgi:hypothetical protein